MSLLLNENDMNTMLEKIRPKNETYIAKMWAMIMTSHNKLFALGALTHVSAYVGVTDRELTIAVLDTIDISHIYHELHVHYDQIKSLKIKSSIIPGQKIIKIETNTSQLNMTLFNNPLSAKIPNQKSAIDRIVTTLSNSVHC